jgi:FtsH-binding integral membrane protein
MAKKMRKLAGVLMLFSLIFSMNFGMMYYAYLKKQLIEYLMIAAIGLVIVIYIQIAIWMIKHD